MTDLRSEIKVFYDDGDWYVKFTLTDKKTGEILSNATSPPHPTQAHAVEHALSVRDIMLKEMKELGATHKVVSPK